ncbi:hypothetical protein GH714_020801 [Hevea brasiliensis]|uniref:Retrotransposon Copia-like N-terminal domain-containing protein n=1 Tax=Hevea brasiliensis TaxID=3981 RepID=A0A6A6LM44_HEVBR|nr:hypothetical protein GH714_020801 [Hevea brasiliensis]
MASLSFLSCPALFLSLWVVVLLISPSHSLTPIKTTATKNDTGSAVVYSNGTRPTSPTPSVVTSNGTPATSPTPSVLISNGTRPTSPTPSVLISNGTPATSPTPSVLISNGTRPTSPTPSVLISNGTPATGAVPYITPINSTTSDGTPTTSTVPYITPTNTTNSSSDGTTTSEEDDYLLLPIVKQKAEENQLTELVDKCTNMQQFIEEAVKMIRIAILCLHNDPTKRPSMSNVVKILEGVKTVEAVSDYGFLTYTVVEAPPKVVMEDNYPKWRRAMINALRVKNKTCFIDGSLPRPTESSKDYVDWEKNNSMALSSLFNSLHSSLHDNVAYYDTIREVWKDLEECLLQGNAPRYQLRMEIVNTQQQNLSVAQYYTKLKGLWDELGSYSEVPPCSCGSAMVFAIEKEKENFLQILMGLHDR